MDEFTPNFSASSFRSVNRVVGESSTTSSLKAAYQERSHSSVGRTAVLDSYSELQHQALGLLRPPHTHPVEISLITPNSRTHLLSLQPSYVCISSSNIRRNMHRAKKQKKQPTKLFQLCFKRFGSSSPSLPLVPSIKALHAEQRLLGPSFS